MSKSVFGFTVNQNVPVLVELTPRAGVEHLNFHVEDLAEKSSHALDSAMAIIQQMARRVQAALETVPDPAPTHIELEFGMKLGVEGRAVVSKTAEDASIRVKLKWNGAEKGF